MEQTALDSANRQLSIIRLHHLIPFFLSCFLSFFLSLMPCLTTVLAPNNTGAHEKRLSTPAIDPSRSIPSLDTQIEHKISQPIAGDGAILQHLP